MLAFQPEQIEFVILSFEGPDLYALAGGLGVRVDHLSQTLAQRGFRTHLFFVGDPQLPGYEERLDGRLVIHRWCQWISQYYPLGVYQGEENKRADFTASLPGYIVQEIAAPLVARGGRLVVLAEEWHTAELLCALSDQLHAAGLRQHAVLFWNANNTMGFEQLDWPRLKFVATLTTVSRYMKQIMRGYDLTPLVIPNGIPAGLLAPVNPDDQAAVRAFIAGLAADPGDSPARPWLLFKVGRYTPAKCWDIAIEAAARLKELGQPVCFPCRGGIEPYGGEGLNHARTLGLRVTDVEGRPQTCAEALALLRAAPPSEIYNLKFFMSQEMLRPFYAVADAVLANSQHEPFGLVGLEAMAAGGAVFTGPTGESYSIDGQGALAMDTESAEEIVLNLFNLRDHPERDAALRSAARQTAARFTWETVLDVLLDKVHLAAAEQNVLPLQTEPLDNAGPALTQISLETVHDVVVYTVVHQPRRLRLPARPIPANASPEVIRQCLLDDEMNEHYFHKVAERCYYPATRRFLKMVEGGFKLTIGFSMSFVEQARQWDPALLELFRSLVSHPNVELAAVEPYHSFILLWDLPRFAERMRWAVDELERIFGCRCKVADTTELMMSDTIYHTLDQIGFQGAFFDGRPWVLEWRQPTYLYRHSGRDLRLLARHYQLSDDVGYRFSNRHWDGWPLMASTYADWLSRAGGDLVVLGWDYETFGEHHAAESGIFDFMEWMSPEVQARGLRFCTASEALEAHGERACDLHLPAFPITWAGSGGMDFFLGNAIQQAVFQLMLYAYNKACLTGNPALIDLALWLAQSDHLHLIQWYGRSGSEAEVSAYFTPREWWPLGPERIVREIQQVYKNFIAALDEHMR